MPILAWAVTIHPGAALAHEKEHHCNAVTSSIEDAGFADEVKVTCESGQAILRSNTYPAHPLMTWIVATNEQIPVPVSDYAAPIPLHSELGDTPQTRDAALGEALNGVPVFDYTGGGEMSLDDLHHHQTHTIRSRPGNSMCAEGMQGAATILTTI